MICFTPILTSCKLNQKPPEQPCIELPARPTTNQPIVQIDDTVILDIEKYRDDIIISKQLYTDILIYIRTLEYSSCGEIERGKR